MSALQATRIPIEGEAGLGYMMRRDCDLPPLNFDREKIEAPRFGWSRKELARDTQRSDPAPDNLIA